MPYQIVFSWLHLQLNLSVLWFYSVYLYLSQWMAYLWFILGVLSCSADSKGNYEQMAFMTDASRWPQFRAGEYGNWDAPSYRSPPDHSISLVTVHVVACLTGQTGLTVIDKLQGDSINYVNIPISPTPKRQLHYMELDLQDRPESSHTIRGIICSLHIYYSFWSFNYMPSNLVLIFFNQLCALPLPFCSRVSS